MADDVPLDTRKKLSYLKEFGGVQRLNGVSTLLSVTRGTGKVARRENGWVYGLDMAHEALSFLRFPK